VDVLTRTEARWAALCVAAVRRSKGRDKEGGRGKEREQGKRVEEDGDEGLRGHTHREEGQRRPWPWSMEEEGRRGDGLHPKHQRVISAGGGQSAEWRMRGAEERRWRVCVVSPSISNVVVCCHPDPLVSTALLQRQTSHGQGHPPAAAAGADDGGGPPLLGLALFEGPHHTTPNIACA